MPRTLVAAFLASALCAVALAPSCDASVTEGCLDGPCGGMGGASASQSASTATGTGGTATGGTATGGSPGADACPAKPQAGDFPCDVFAVIHANCNPCHQNPPLNGAPFPLLTYADTQKPIIPGKLIFQQMYDQTRPDALPRMPLGGSLKPADFTTLSDWLAMCAPPVKSGTGCGCPGKGCN